MPDLNPSYEKISDKVKVAKLLWGVPCPQKSAD